MRLDPYKEGAPDSRRRFGVEQAVVVARVVLLSSQQRWIEAGRPPLYPIRRGLVAAEAAGTTEPQWSRVKATYGNRP